jgi:hypothetical protein
MRDLRGARLLNKYKYLFSDYTALKQPQQCKGCIYGRWEGSKQFCSKQVCVKDKQQ